MNQHNQLRHKNAGLAGAIFGSLLIGLSSTAALAAPVSHVLAEAPTIPVQVAPTPSMPGVATYGSTPSNPPGTPRTLPVQPPLPENRSQPIAMVMPMEGKVNVKLKNNTNAVISYEALGSTQRRFLRGGEKTVLRNLPTPVTVTLVRQDKGLLKVIPISNSQPGMLQVSLDEAKHLSDSQGVLRIQKDGEVFLN